MADCKMKYPSSTILFTFTYLQLMSFAIIAMDTLPLPLPAYSPIDNIVLSCGFSGNSSISTDNRFWIGDVNSKFFPSNFHLNNASETHYSLAPSFVPYVAARFSHSQFTYFFSVTPGHNFIRLHFYSYLFQNFDRYKALFSVKAGPFTLLRDFNASAYSHFLGSNTFFREYCVNIEGNNQTLNISFTPSNEHSYAFISGIEIVSIPTNLYYTPMEPNDQGGRGLKLIGQNNKFFPIETYMSLEVVYRVNIGGTAISPQDDTGMFRTWLQESNLLDDFLDDARPASLDIQLNYTKIQPYTAPEDVYRTARTMGPNATRNKSYNLTWEYPVDPGFFYMLRLHFCEFEKEINDSNDRVFLIYIRDMIAEPSADVFRWAGGKGIPYYRDYAVLVPPSNDNKKVNLSVKLQANPNDFMTRFTNVILNGIEIFKLTDTNGNLAGPNPDLPPPTSIQFLPPPILQSKNSNDKTMMIVILAVVGGTILIFSLGSFVFQRWRSHTDKRSSDGTSLSIPYSMNMSSKTHTSSLPCNQCHHFSLSEIRDATEDFNDAFIIGIGGFGNVYKGYIQNGATQVAIKRLKPDSKQGAHEFKTEIEMLSQLRHLHLVSLIGYCNDNNEMILVYDYMSRGTLQNHLYSRNDEQKEEPPLTWKQRLEICIGAARGLHYLHTGGKHTIIHRDVKTSNILLDEKWVAKVSDFGLSKFGPTNMSKAYVSTMVKGSFGYLDPEYCRRRQLSEKSDVYSFGVVLCEVLSGRPPIIHTVDKTRLLLTEWVQRCIREKTVTQIIDPIIKNEIAPECFRKFIQITVSCIQDEGNKRPSMNDVVRGLEFASQLQQSSKEGNVEFNSLDSHDGCLFGLGDDMSSNIMQMATSNNEDSSFVINKGMSGIVFTELKNLQPR